MPVPILAVASDPPRPTGRVTVVRALAGNPFVAPYVGGAAPHASIRPSIPVALATAMFATLVHLVMAPVPVDVPIVVALAGLTAWQAAASTAREPSARWSPANDNPPRPHLPPHALW